MNSTDLFVDGVLEDVQTLNLMSFVDTCTIYPLIPEISNGRGGYTTGFAPGLTVPCRLDTDANRLLPSKAKDDVDVLKVQRNIYIPYNTVFSYTNSSTTDISSQVRAGYTDTLGDQLFTLSEEVHVQLNPVNSDSTVRTVDIGDELETSAGNPSGNTIRYRVIDVTIETDQTDIGLLVEVVY